MSCTASCTEEVTLVIYEPSVLAVAIFGLFVAITLGISFYFGNRAKSASAYFAAGGEIHHKKDHQRDQKQRRDRKQKSPDDEGEHCGVP